MRASDSATEAQVLAEWAEEECSHLDIIASWDELLSSYQVLGFTDPITDEQRLVEFKYVIGETNKFLTRMKNGLAKTRSIKHAIEFLAGHMNTADMSTVSSREQVAYNNAKQRWVRRAIATLRAAMPDEQEEREEADER